MSWEREFEHMRDYGHTWGPGLDEKPSDVVATIDEDYKVALDIINKDNVEKLLDGKELEVVRLRNLDNVLHDYDIVNTIEDLPTGGSSYVVIYKYVNKLPEGYIPNLCCKINKEDVLLCAKITKKIYEDETYIFLEDLLKESIINADSLYCNDSYNYILREMEKASKRLEPTEAIKQLLPYLDDLRSKCSCIPPQCYYEEKMYYTYRNYVLAIIENEYKKYITKLIHFNNQVLNSVLITFDESNGGLVEHRGVIFKECSIKEIQQFFVDLSAVASNTLFVCFRDDKGEYHYENINDDAVLLDKLENWGYEFNGMDKQCESCVYEDSCGNDREMTHCDGYKSK